MQFTKHASRSLIFFTSIVSLLFFGSCHQSTPDNWQWETITTIGEPTARHEAGLVAYKDKLYLMGGRTSEFDVVTNTWASKSSTPIELHHFQPVVVDDAIYIIGAMTGQWLNEKTSG